MLLYRPGHYLQNPWEIPALWEGGMSFHGGLIGVVLAITIFSWREKLPLGGVADAIALASPPAILLGRIANFINAELWGRPTVAALGRDLPRRGRAGLPRRRRASAPAIPRSSTRRAWKACSWACS